MGSYLHNVAARVLGQSLSVQPRVPSLFEPPAASMANRLTPFMNFKPAPAWHEESESAAHESWRFHPQLERVADTTGPISTHNNQPELQTQDQSRAQIRPSFEQRQTERDTRKAIRPQSTESDRSLLAEIATQPKPRNVLANFLSDETRSAVPPERTARIESMARSLPLAPQIGERELSLTNSSEPRPAKSEPRFEADSRTARLSVSPAPHGVPQRPPATPTPPAERNVDQANEVGPNISVVIGRVSVQAVMQQAAAVRPPLSPPAPLLSLDQYLKQRGGES
jgi:hypothetical protein